MPTERAVAQIAMPRLYPVALVTTGYLLVFGVTLGWLLDADASEAALCLAPAAGTTLLGVSSQADRRQYVVRILAAAMFLPALLLMWASSHAHGGLWLVAVVAVHVLALLALLLWLAAFTTRIHALAGITPVAPERLGRRFVALQAAGAPLVVVGGDSAADWLIDLRPSEGSARTHRVRLQIDGPRRVVRVQELVGADAAKPETAEERSMRGPGDPVFDPARPDAQAVWSRTWQATMIVPERLAATATEFAGDAVRYTLPADARQDAEAWVTLLAALVTRSGYAWQPRLFDFGQR